MRQVIDRAIVLRRTNYGERDRVVTLLTKENGKITVFAKGVRAQKSRLSAGVELLSISEVGFIEGKSDMKTLISANLKVHFDRIVHDIETTRKVFESLKRITKLVEEGGGQEYFDLLEVYLRSLQNPDFDRDLVEVWFGLKLLKITGVLGHIDVRKLEENKNVATYSFNYDEQYFMQDPNGGFTENDIKLLRILDNNNAPIRLKKNLGTEPLLLQFTHTLFGVNLG